jgi:hypothetical protein
MAADHPKLSCSRKAAALAEAIGNLAGGGSIDAKDVVASGNSGLSDRPVVLRLA